MMVRVLQGKLCDNEGDMDVDDYIAIFEERLSQDARAGGAPPAETLRPLRGVKRRLLHLRRCLQIRQDASAADVAALSPPQQCPRDEES